MYVCSSDDRQNIASHWRIELGSSRSRNVIEQRLERCACDFGSLGPVEAIVYILVGLAAIMKLFHCKCKKCMGGMCMGKDMGMDKGMGGGMGMDKNMESNCFFRKKPLLGLFILLFFLIFFLVSFFCARWTIAKSGGYKPYRSTRVCISERDNVTY